MENALMQNTLQGGYNNGGIFTTLNVADEKDADLLLSTQDNENMLKVNDVKGQILEVIGLFIRERNVQDTNDDGEVIDYFKHTTILFTKDDKMYVTGSNSFFMSLDLICKLKGNPSREKPLKIKVSSVPAKEQGHTYLKAVLVKDEEKVEEIKA